ncbi:hypothetical protein ScPMuIL_010116 [Solemya velum]
MILRNELVLTLIEQHTEDRIRTWYETAAKDVVNKFNADVVQLDQPKSCSRDGFLRGNLELMANCFQARLPPSKWCQFCMTWKEKIESLERRDGIAEGFSLQWHKCNSKKLRATDIRQGISEIFKIFLPNGTFPSWEKITPFVYLVKHCNLFEGISVNDVHHVLRMCKPLNSEGADSRLNVSDETCLFNSFQSFGRMIEQPGKTNLYLQEKKIRKDEKSLSTGLSSESHHLDLEELKRSTEERLYKFKSNKIEEDQELSKLLQAIKDGPLHGSIQATDELDSIAENLDSVSLDAFPTYNMQELRRPLPVIMQDTAASSISPQDELKEEVEKFNKLGVIQIDHLAQNLGDKHMEAGHCLQINDATLRDMKNQYLHLPYERNYQIIMKWKRSVGQRGTLQHLKELFVAAGLEGLIEDIPHIELTDIYTHNDENELSRGDQTELSRILGDNYTRFLRLLGVSEEAICDGLLSRETRYEQTYQGIQNWKNAMCKAERTRGKVISVLIYIDRQDIVEKLNPKK